MKKILITGGAGFVGSNLAILFKKYNPNFHITCFDNLKRRGSELMLKRLQDHSIQFYHGDLRNKSDFEELEHYDLVIDCAAEPSVMAGISNSPNYLIETNLVGTLNLLEFLRFKPAPIIFLSTSRIYPIETINSLAYKETDSRFELLEKQNTVGASHLGFNENFPLHGIRSLYGTTKLSAEYFIQEYGHSYQIPYIINRLGVLTGPWQMGKVDQGVIVYWLAAHLFKKSLAYFGYGGQGKQVRDILHVEDLFDLLIIQMNNFSKHNQEIYNVGGGRDVSISLKELTQIANELSGNHLKIKPVLGDRANDIRIYLTDHSKITSKTGWTPKRNTEFTLRQIYAWIYENKSFLEKTLFP